MILGVKFPDSKIFRHWSDGRRPLLRLAIAGAALPILALAALASVRIYRAEKLVEEATEENLRKAVALAPGNSDAWAQLGALLDRRGESVAAVQALERAVALNRYDPAAWISLGLDWELQGQPQKAEQCLLEAARVDRTFAPRWALANFYLRQGNEDQFWPAIRGAISCRQADLNASFELCWRAFRDPDPILDKAVPDIPEVNKRYFGFLLQTGRKAAAAAVWDRLQKQIQPADVGLALHYIDLSLTDGQFEQALRVWNRLCETRLIDYETLDPARGRVLTNAKFRLPPSGMAFDWRLPPPAGFQASVETPATGPCWRVRFSGGQPEATDLLSQLAPTLPAQIYQLKFRYQTDGLPADTGIYWRVEDVASGAGLMTGPPLAGTGESWEDGRIRFRTGPRTRLVRLVFAYRRSPGTTRSQGSVALSDLDVKPEDRSQESEVRIKPAPLTGSVRNRFRRSVSKAQSKGPEAAHTEPGGLP